MAEIVARLKNASYLRKWLILGVVIGVVAGLGAIAFIVALETSGKLLLEGLGGYKPPLPIGEGNRLLAGHFDRPWAIPLVVALGGLISGFLVFRYVPEAEGHGTDAAIAAVHHNPRGIRGRVTAIKIVASAATIGAGGSAGREGPTAQISAGFGSLLARRLQLTPQDSRIAVSVGIGAGIGSIFRAPLGGRGPRRRDLVSRRSRTGGSVSVAGRVDCWVLGLRRRGGFRADLRDTADEVVRSSGPARVLRDPGCRGRTGCPCVRPRLLRHGQIAPQGARSGDVQAGDCRVAGRPDRARVSGSAGDRIRMAAEGYGRRASQRSRCGWCWPCRSSRF